VTHRTTPVVLSILAALSASSCDEPAEDYARGYVIESLAEGVGGPKAIAREGDLVLENQHGRIAVLAARNSLGPGLHGGSIVDADIHRTDPASGHGRGRDQLAELFPTANMDVMHPLEGSVELVSDGSDGGPAVIRTVAARQPFLTLLDGLWTIVRAPAYTFVNEYRARPGVPWFELHTEVHYADFDEDDLAAYLPGPLADTVVAAPGHEESFPLINWAIESGVVLGDFYLQGGSVDVFAPGIGFDEDGAVFESMQRGDNTFLDPFQFPFLAGVADGVSYGLAPATGDLWVPLFTASQTVAVGAASDGDGSSERFDPSTALSYDRYFFLGHGDVGSILDQYLEARQIPYGTVSGFVVESSTAAAASGVNVFVYEPGADKPFSQFLTDVHPDDRSADGSFGGRLPVGTWELMAHERGRPDGQRVTVQVKRGAESEVVLDIGRAGVLSFQVRDERGLAVPAKVTIFPVGDTRPTRDPVLGDGFIGGAPEAVLFALHGRGEVELAPGRYQAVASRGLEYELDISEPFTIDGAVGAELDLMVERSVDSTGWVSADLHVHAQHSHDSGVLLADRVRTMVTEGVEFFASTDHDYLVDYAPTVEMLGMEPWVQTAVGNETTTVEVGHFLGFPLDHDFMTEAGGGREEVDWTGKTPQEIIDSLRMMGNAGGFDPAIFVGHPRDGILGYFDQFGFDPAAGEPGVAGEPGTPEVSIPILNSFNDLLQPENMSWDVDGLELLNGKRFELLRTPTATELEAYAEGEATVLDFFERTLEEQQGLQDGTYVLSEELNGQIDDWFTLLNLGFRFTVLGNSDTHGLTSTESGCPRNYVMSDTDDPALLDDQAIADAVKQHRVVASYGPFVQMWVQGQPIGSEVRSSNGQATVQVEVQAPTWMDADRVEIYRNGTLVDVWDIPAGPSVVRLSRTETYEVEGDSWFVAIVTGDEELAPVFTPVEIPYVELELVVTEALGGVPAVSFLLSEATPIPRQFPVRPYAVTNPVWVETGGDGFDAPGVPEWLAP
jgi:hypothetical protein